MLVATTQSGKIIATDFFAIQEVFTHHTITWRNTFTQAVKSVPDVPLEEVFIAPVEEFRCWSSFGSFPAEPLAT